MREAIARPEGFTSCYGCGRDNPRGLKAHFFRDGDEVVADFTGAADHGGYGRVLHGGVIATLLDEAFGWATFGLLGRIGITTDLQVDFLGPAFSGEPLTVRARIIERDDKRAVVRAEIAGPDGKVLATGSGTLRFVSLRAIERIGSFKAGV